MKRSRRILAILVIAPVVGWCAYTLATRVPVRVPERKVVVLGFDGADPRLCRDFMEKGLLPNLSELMREGTFMDLATVNPSQSPVSWSSFAVGGDPGAHGIFDFLTRNPTAPTYAPSPESFVGQIEARFFAGIPIRRPKAINKRGGRAFWDYAAEDGIKTALFLLPVTFAPPCLPNGLAFSGLGVPDLCGTQAKYFFLTSSPSRKNQATDTEFGGLLGALSRVGDIYHGQLIGPPSPLWKQQKSARAERLEKLKRKVDRERVSSGQESTTEAELQTLQAEYDIFRKAPERLTMPIEIEPDPNGRGARVRVDQDLQEVQVGKWSDWFRVRFKVTRLISAHGICKVLLQSVTPIVDIYVSPVEISPEKPVIPICCPSHFSARLAKKVGLFKTRGWESDTAGLKEGAIDEKAFVEDTLATMDQQGEMLLETLAHDDWSLFVGVLSETDRMSHAMWRLIDPQHPRFDPELAARFGDSIRKTYQKMDEIVGKVRERIDESRTDLYVISDHGFQSFRKGVNLNTWLSRHGPGGDSDHPFMELRIPVDRKYNLEDLFGGKTDYFMTDVFDPVSGATRSEWYVNWRETEAFALGLGSIFINLKGRETHGAVPRSQYDAICEEIARGLEALVDPDTGERVIHKVYRGMEIFHGPYAKVESTAFPDLMVGFAEGYRVGWQSTLGGIEDQIISPNGEKWSGDHCGVDPSLTSGILFTNRKVTSDRAGVVDLAPTILSALGVKHASMQGRALSVDRGGGSP